MKRYRETIEKHLKPAFGKDKLHELDALTTEADDRRYVRAELSIEGVSFSTVELIHAVPSSALKSGGHEGASSTA